MFSKSTLPLSDSVVPTAAPSPLVAFVKPLGIGLVIAVAFVLTYLSALHDPKPHELPVGMVASAQVVGQLGERIGESVAPREVSDEESARREIEEGRLVAAYLPGGRLLLAGAHGPAVTQAVTGIFTDVAAVEGAPLQVTDVVPLTAADPRGLSSFYLLFGITLAGFIFGQTSHMYSKQLTTTRKLVQAVVFAALVGLAGAFIAGPMIDVQPGSFVVVAGILILLALVTALVTQGFTALLGDPGILVSTLLLVILGNATSGGAVPASFLPSGFRWLSPLLPPGAATEALNEVAYFDPDAAWQPMGVLVLWAIGAVALVVLAYRRTP